MAAPMNNVRVKLSFQNSTNNCWFLINTTSANTIRDVEHHIAARFGSGDGKLCLFLEDCRLPSEESVQVLRDNDTITVVASSSTQKTSSTYTPLLSTSPTIEVSHNNNSFASSSLYQLGGQELCTESGHDEEQMRSGKKKHKKHKRLRESTDDVTEITKKEKKKRHKNISVNPDHNVSKNNQEEETPEECEEPKKKKSRISTPSLKESDVTDEPPSVSNPHDANNEKQKNDICDDMDTEGDLREAKPDSDKSKPKRRRVRRKRKTSTKTAIVVTELSATPFARGSKPPSSVTHNAAWGPLLRNLERKYGTEEKEDRVHMHFESDDESPQDMQQNVQPSLEPTDSRMGNGSNETSLVMGGDMALSLIDAVETVSESDPQSASVSVLQQPCDTSGDTSGTEKQRTGTQEPLLSISSEADGDKCNGKDAAAENFQCENARTNADRQLECELHHIPGYTVVPPPVDYKPKQWQPQNHQQNKKKSSPGASHLQGAQVFSRRRNKKSGFIPLSKEEQLNSRLTNKSVVFQNANGASNGSNGTPKIAESQQKKEPPKDYSAMVLLHGLPREKDKIAFKVLEMSAACTPEMSDFKEAVVLKYDPVTKMVDLEMLGSEAQRKASRFDLVVEDEEEILTNVTQDSLKSFSWTSLVDVRLMPSS